MPQNETPAQAMAMFFSVKSLIIQSLQIGPRGDLLSESSPLLGAIPELDSMAVVNIITALEDHFGFVVDDDEISAETFGTLGSLVDFVSQKLNG